MFRPCLDWSNKPSTTLHNYSVLKTWVKTMHIAFESYVHVLACEGNVFISLTSTFEYRTDSDQPSGEYFMKSRVLSMILHWLIHSQIRGFSVTCNIFRWKSQTISFRNAPTACRVAKPLDDSTAYCLHTVSTSTVGCCLTQTQGQLCPMSQLSEHTLI